MLIPSLIAGSCGLLLVDREFTSRRSIGRAGRRAALAAITLGVLGAASTIAGVFGLAAEKQDYLLDTFTWYEVIHSVMLAPVAEEILFTGFLYTVLRSRRGLVFATLTVAAIFTLAHLPDTLSSFSVRFAHAVCSCLLLERFKCLYLNVGMHSLANAMPIALTGAPSLLIALSPFLTELSYLLGAFSALGMLAIGLWLMFGPGGIRDAGRKPARLDPAS